MARATLLGKQVNAITVIDGDSSALSGLGWPVDALACGRRFEYQEICEPSSDEIFDAELGHMAFPFIVSGAQRFVVRCTPEEASSRFISAFDAAAEHLFGHVLWNGSEEWPDEQDHPFIYLTSPEVAGTNVSGVADAKAAVASVLHAAYEAHPELDPILHLGFGAALEIGEDLGVLNIPYVVNSAYPVDGVAVTGPITIRVGTIQDLTHVDWKTNRRYAEGNRFGLIEFDPCLARVGTTSS